MERIVKRVYYHDTDCGGVVYYANYLKYMEEARTEYMRQRGIDLKKWADKGIMFVVRKVEIDYKFPARYGEILDIYTKVEEIRSVSLNFSQEMMFNNKVLVCAKTGLVCINADFRPEPIPQELVVCLK